MSEKSQDPTWTGPHRTRDKRKVGPMEREKCGAKKRNGEKCGLPAGYGTDHSGTGPCKHHFGATEGVERGAAIAFGKHVAQKLVGMGAPRDIDPIDALVEEVRRTAGHVHWHEQKIAQWQVSDAEAFTAEQAEFYERYMREREHLTKTSLSAIRAGVAERAVALAEKQGEVIANAIDAILAALNLTDAQLALVPEVVPRVLHSVAVRAPLVLEGSYFTDEETK